MRTRGLLVGLVVLGMVFGVGLMALANGQDTCPEGGGWVKADNLSGLTYTLDVPDGFIATENCFKASTTLVFGTGPTVTNTTVFNSPQGVTCTAVGVPHGGCNLQNISHASFLLEEEPSETTTTTAGPTTTTTGETTTTLDETTTTVGESTTTTSQTSTTAPSSTTTDPASPTTSIPTGPNPAPTTPVSGPDELPFTGAGGIAGLILAGSALVAGGVSLVRRARG